MTKKANQTSVPEPGPDNDFLADHVQLLCSSYRNLLGKELFESPDPISLAAELYNAPFVVLSHDTQADPVFNYANRRAQFLFGIEWHDFTQTASRFSAEAPNREERARLLQRVSEQGFIDDYQGVRIAADGSRFVIEQAVVWNLIDHKGEYRGQAATFSCWQPL